MKISRRNFLKGGTLLAACLVAGLKPKAPKVMRELSVRHVSVMFDGDFLEAVPHDPEQIARAFRIPPWEALYGGAAGAGKTPVITLGDLEAMLWSFEPPYTQSQRAWIENIFLEAQFLEGDPDLHCRGVLVVKEDMHV